MMRILNRWWWLIRSHRPSQMARRLGRRAKTALFPLLPRAYLRASPAGLQVETGPTLARILDRHAALRAARSDLTTVEDLEAGRVRLLNASHDLGCPFAWNPFRTRGASHLWEFHLHYHEFLLDLVVPAGPDGRQSRQELAWRIVADWIEANPCESEALRSSWHPFCISRRVPVWLMLWQWAPPPPDLAERVLASLEAQLGHLERNLETDLGGNHLIENARGLAMGGAFLSGPRAGSRLRTASRLVAAELPRQLLPHGEHFERAPTYHAQMLSALLDVGDALAGRDEPRCREIAAATGAMMVHLDRILHADHQVPLLGDSTLGDTPSPPVLREAVGRSPDPPPGALLAGETFVFRDRNDFLLVDTGPVGPDHLPAHAHCDLLNVELSCGGQRVIVDSGVFDYEAGDMRDYCRSTGAHNVFRVAGAEQCDVWSSFRMGYRGRPTSRATGETDRFSWCRATHDAFRRVGVPSVGRWVAAAPDGPWLVMDWARSERGIRTEVLIHIHPDVAVQGQSESSVVLELQEGALYVEFFTPGALFFERGWYCPEFGVRRENTVLRYETEGIDPYVCWGVRRADDPGRVSVSDPGSGAPVIEWTVDEARVRLAPVG